jgi:hypothetical protein
MNLIRPMFHFQLITVLLHGAIHNRENQGCTHLHLMQLLVQFQLLPNNLMQKAKL